MPILLTSFLDGIVLNSIALFPIIALLNFLTIPTSIILYLQGWYLVVVFLFSVFFFFRLYPQLFSKWPRWTASLPREVRLFWREKIGFTKLVKFQVLYEKKKYGNFYLRSLKNGFLHLFFSIYCLFVTIWCLHFNFLPISSVIFFTNLNIYLTFPCNAVDRITVYIFLITFPLLFVLIFGSGKLSHQIWWWTIYTLLTQYVNKFSNLCSHFSFNFYVIFLCFRYLILIFNNHQPAYSII